jgi:hypothetical protein
MGKQRYVHFTPRKGTPPPTGYEVGWEGVIKRKISSPHPE